MSDEKITKLWEYYQNGVAYQNQLGITESIPQCVDFFEGRQWAAPTEKTRNMPRPVVNIVKMIVRNKKSGIVGGKVKLVFNADKDKERSDRMTAFNDFIESEMGMDELRNRLADSGTIKGSGFMHYYWDSEARGLKGEYEGGVRAEIIDPLSIFFSNPQETDEQKQKWIMILSRVEIDAVKAMADPDVDKELIVADNLDSTNYTGDYEQEGSNLCTVLTRYFRKNGEVYYERGTRAVMLHKPIALTPDLKELSDSDEDSAETELPDKAEKSESAYKATLFPIEVYNYELREKSIYGLSEVEGIIPNQKSINFNLGMQLLSVQNQAWGKYVVKEGALKQKITNQPGETLTDYYKGGGDGIKKMQEQPFSSMPIQLVDNLITSTRMATGSTEVVTGEQVSANQSGAAIAQLQSQALKPIEELRARFWRACEKGGKILEQFYKLFYEGKQFSYKRDNDSIEDVFNGDEYADADFSITVEAGAGTQFSESLTIVLLDNLMQAGHIDFMTYIEMYPDSAMPFKSTLKQRMTEREASENIQLKTALEQSAQQSQAMQEQIKQLVEYVKQMQSTTQQAAGIIKVVDELKQQLAALKIEGASKIMAQNEALMALSQKNKQTKQDAQQLALIAAVASQQSNKTAPPVIE